MIIPSPQLHRYTLALRKPLRLLDLTLHDREGAIAVLTCDEGTELYADICPLPTIHTETLAEACAQWQDTVVPLLNGLSFDPAGFDPSQPCLGLLRTADGDAPVIGALWHVLYPSVAFALEAALLCGWSSHLDSSAPTTHKARDYAVVFYPRSTKAWLSEARQAYADGHRLFKIKIGGDRWPLQQKEIAELLASCPELELRLDANRQLSATHCQKLRSWPVQFVEDLVGDEDVVDSTMPTSEVPSPWPTAIDDGLWGRDIPDASTEPPKEDVLVLKPSRLKGGLSATWRWLELAHRHGRCAHLSSCYESGLGVRAQLILHHLAVANFGTDTVLTPGFSPYLALTEDVLATPLPLQKGSTELPKFAAQTPQGIGEGFDWLSAIRHDGVCLITPEGGRVTYAVLRARVVQQVARLKGIPPTTWRLAADDTLTVWVATLACLASGHRLLPVHGKTPEAQLEEWAALCPMEDWPPPAEGAKSGATAPGSGELLIATSGSTGQRKLARLTSRGLYYSALGTNRFYDIQAEDCWGLCLPLFHVGGLMILLRATLAGAAVIQLPARYASEAEALYEQMTILSAVPSQWQELMDHCSAEALSSLKAVLIGGAAAPESLTKESTQRGLPISLTYGMTEAGAQLLASAPGTAAPMVALDFRAVTLTQEGRGAGRGARRIAFRGPMAFAGYEGQPAHDSGTWFETQDLGVRRDGSLAILGRADRQIIKGGENIPLALAERVAGELGLMARAVPYNHHRYGQWYRLVIASPEVPTGSEVEAALAAAMPKFWLPEVTIWRSSVGLAGIKLSAAEAEQAVADHLDGQSRPSDELNQR